MRPSQDNLESQRVRRWRKGCRREGHCAKDKDFRGGHLRKESFLVAQISTSILKTPSITCSWFQHCSPPPLPAWNLGSYLIFSGYEIWHTSRGKSYIKSVVPQAHFHWTFIEPRLMNTFTSAHWTSAEDMLATLSTNLGDSLVFKTCSRPRRAAVDREAFVGCHPWE